MNFLLSKWPWWVDSLVLIILIMLGLYIFNDAPGFSGVFQAAFGYAQEAVDDGSLPQVEWDWHLGMAAGVFVGALGGALINKSWKFTLGFEEAQGLAGKSVLTILRGMAAGFLVMLGAILSGEAFYGQVAAAVELSAGAWFFLTVSLISGGITALFIERKSASGAGGKGKEDK